MSEPKNRAGERSGTPVTRWEWLARRVLTRARSWIAPGHLDPAERNARYLEIEVLWASLLAGAVAFNAPFALRLGASNAEIGLLSSIPALIALIITVPAGQFLSRRARRMPWMIGSLFLARIAYLFLALAPLLRGVDHGALVIGLLIAFSAPASVFGVAWNSMLAEVIPETNRARVFATRNILVACAATAAIFLAGRWLERAPFPLNYQVMYGIGLIGGMLSIYYVMRLRVPDSVVPALVRPGAAGQPLRIRALLHTAREARASYPDFFRIVGNTFAHGLGLWMIAPLYVLYYVRQLGADEGWLGLNATLASLTPAIGYYLWQRAIVRWGEKRVLVLNIAFVGLYPLLVGLTPHLTPILALTAIYGLWVPGTNLAHFNMLLKICPAAQRPLYIGLYTSIMNAGAFVAPLIGVALADRFGFAPVLVAGGVLCLAGSSLFRWRSFATPDGLAVRRGELNTAA